MPGYLEKQDELKAAGIDDVLVYCVNDGAVMTGWAKDQGIDGSMITFLGDPTSKLTEALGMVFDTVALGITPLGYPRCKRFALYIDDGVIKVWNVSGTEADPAGDDDPSASAVEGMLASIAAL